MRTQAAVATRASMVTTSSSSSSSSSTSAAPAAALEAAQLQLMHAQQDAQRQAAAYTMLEATCAALRADLEAARAQTAAVEAELESAHTAAASARLAMEKREALAVEAEAAQRTQALATAELTAQLEAANALIARRDAALVAAEIGMWAHGEIVSSCVRQVNFIFPKSSIISCVISRNDIYIGSKTLVVVYVFACVCFLLSQRRPKSPGSATR